MANDISAMKRDIERRLRDLPQLIEEHDRLTAAHRILSSNDRHDDDPVAVPRRRAARGANRGAILAVVKERPGIASSQIAVATGIAKTVVYSTVAHLKRDGEIQPEKGGYKIARR
ncbi:hypothetical protein Q5424_01040 [Conexibacter sp. JD483]|uniref:hypothetical protein n=1 Tax=unclassified Conexibacter TaxID=2627773 RepID=UPI002720E8B0|nr:MULTISPECIES: hypothetical protein [unclassified Conexibacter]MDO8185813.1 hypothetical protein [Conexibacter sp. CPCC 205706]MDO8198557.1 hypothetical protein [Conexibacter sp. CPCC 205762]MDR9367643.1 hypothetical protein [Conexibacter sp. JD483]